MGTRAPLLGQKLVTAVMAGADNAVGDLPDEADLVLEPLRLAAH
jgi:hypothetical protein